MPIDIKQGKYLIAKNTDILTTAGLATCTALGMRFGDEKFLAHIDAHTEIEPMIDHIKTTLKNLNATVTEAHIWSGSGIIEGIMCDSTLTTTKAKSILTVLDVSNPHIPDYDVIHLGDKIQCNVCGTVSGTLKILTHYFDCKYKGSVIYSSVLYWEEVNI